MPALTPIVWRVDWGLLAFCRTEEEVGVVGDDTVFPKKRSVGLLVMSLTFHGNHSGSQSPQVMAQAPGSCGPFLGWL